MNTELTTFIKEALVSGESRSSIQKALIAGGWQKDEVHAALESFADVSFPIPVPKRRPYMSAREAFMYLVLFLTLYITAISFGTLLFQFINRAFPDPLQLRYMYDGTTQTIRWSTSALVIAFPVFIWISAILQKAIRKDPDKRGSKIRKWLTYITLFVTAGIMIGDLITLVYNLLGGELTPRFILKVLTVGAISGTIFGYYLWDLRKEEKES